MKVLACCLAAVAAFLSMAAAAQPVTALWYERVGGTQAADQVNFVQSPPAALEVIRNGLDAFEVFFGLGTPGQVRFAIAPPPDTSLQAGPYESARRYRVAGISPGVELFDSVGCTAEDGRFVVLDVQVDSQQKITSLAVNFEIQRMYDSGRIYGEARVASAVPFTRDEPAGQTVPDAMGFAAVPHARPGEVRVSHSTTVYGIDAPVPIQVSGGEYSINEGPFTAAAGTVAHRDRVRVRATAPLAHGSESAATLVVGTVAAEFRVRTFVPGEPINALRLHNEPDNGLFPAGDTDLLAPDWKVSASFASEAAIQVGVAGRGHDGYVFQVTAREGVLVPGPREDLLDLSQADWRMNLSGLGHGCTPIGRIVIIELAWHPDGSLDRFAANFEQRCDHAPGRTFGELRINSAVPLSWMASGPDAVPDAFALMGERVAMPEQAVEFAPFSLYGLDAAAPIAIAGGEYRVNGGPYTTSAGTVSRFDRVQVRAVAAPTPGDTREVELTIGGIRATASIRTWEDGDTVSGTWSRVVRGDGAVFEKLIVAPPHRMEAYAEEGSFLLRPHHRDGTSLYFGMGAARGEALRPGRYVVMPDDFFGASLDLTFGGCIDGESEARFVVYEYERSATGEPQVFAADIEFHCSGAGSVSRAAVRFNSKRPLPVLRSGPACTEIDADDDGMTDCQELAELRHPGIKDNDVFGDARLFAMQQYRDFLAREGEAGGIEYWSGQVGSGSLSRGAAIEQFLGSPEFAGAMAPVARLYLAYFLRIPDKEGLDFWVDFRARGNSMDDVSNYFAQSAEFAATYGALDNAAFVDRVYRNVLGRAPDAGGLAFWRDQLDRGIRTRGQVMLAFSESPEYAALTANDIFVTMTYFGMLQRAPDAGGYAHWVGYMDQGNSGLALIDAFLGAPEYRNRFLP